MDEFNQLLTRLKEEHNSYSQDNVFIGDFTYGNPLVLDKGVSTRLTIGKFCSIAAEVTIFLGGEHRSEWMTTYPFNVFLNEFNYIKGHPKSKGDVKIGNDVWIGRRATILSGVTIGDGAIIGASALVTKSVPPYAIVGGNPVKFIKYRFNKSMIKKLQEIKWWDWDLEKIKEAVPILQSKDYKGLVKYYRQNFIPKRKKWFNR